MSIETMTKLATVTVGAGGAANIEFTNIPQTYTDLVIKISQRSARTGFAISDTGMQFNNDTTDSYNTRRLYGSGSSATSDSLSSASRIYWGYSAAANATASTFNNSEIYVPRYTSANFKSVSIDAVMENNATEAYTFLNAGIWNKTDAITSIKLVDNNGANFVQHTTATLYGIKNARKTAGNSIKATGGNISFDGTYVVHTFNSSGTFTPTVGLTADYLVVAGGGGAGQAPGSGANYGTGGGGAGGFRTSAGTSGGGASAESKISLSSNVPYSVTIGAGGAAGSTGNATNGTNSIFANITSLGGGAGFYSAQNVSIGGVGNGGSGGGQSYANYSGSTKGFGTAGQGYDGGSGNNDGSIAGSGGGAGGAGGTGTDGGIGVQSSISGTLNYYAGGGAAGTSTTRFGGLGGGGNQNASGTANTGGGGGGRYGTGSGSTSSGTGGSGIVIIRYKA